MINLLIGAGILAAVQLAGVLLCRLLVPSDARGIWQGLVVATVWWVLAPWSYVADGRRRRRWEAARQEALRRRDHGADEVIP